MPITLIDFSEATSLPIERFSSSQASSSSLTDGSGESHVHAVYFEPGGIIGPHPAGFDQLFLVVRGAGWVAGSNGARLEVATGQAAYIPTGEIHSKGSETGMTAIMVQARRLHLPDGLRKL